MYAEFELLISILVVGIATFLMRAYGIFTSVTRIEHPLISKAMEAIPASMLVAFVVPYAFLKDKTLIFWRPEVLAILVTLLVVFIIRRPGYGLPIALCLYFALEWAFQRIPLFTF